jgi:ferredoxin-NADP reductase
MATLSVSCESSRVLLIAGGVGIAPLHALFETLPVNPGQNVMLLYRAKGTKQLGFRQVHEERFAL